MIGSRPFSNAYPAHVVNITGSDGLGGLVRSFWRTVVFFGGRLRGPQPLPFGRGEVPSLSDQTLLVRLEFGDALLDLLPQGSANPVHRRKPGRFDDGWRKGRFRLNALR